MKKLTYYISLIALFLIPIFPLIVANQFFFPFITGKAFYFRILTEIAFASWIILACLDAKYRPKLNSLTVTVTLFTIVTLLADILGVNPLRSLWSNFERMEGWITIIHLWAFFIAATSLFGVMEAGKRNWHRFMNMELIVATIVAIYGFAQLLNLLPTHQGSRVDASLGNAAYMAVYMLFSCGIAAYMAVVEYGKKNVDSDFLKWIYPILTVLFGFILFETGTRGTTLGLIGGIMLASAIYAIFGKGESSKLRYASGGIILAVILVGSIFWMNKDSAFVQKYEVLRRMASISWSDTSNQARQFIWPVAINGALERPILGWGQENFNYIFNANYNPKMWSQEQWFDRAHSVFLDWFVAGGFVGLIAYLALYIVFLFAVWKSTLTISEKSILTGLLAGYAVHNIFVFDNLASYVMFFLILGFASSLREGKNIKLLGTESMRTDAVEYIVAPIVVVVLVLTLYMFNVKMISANTRLIDALVGCEAKIGPDAALYQKALSLNMYTANQEIREQLMSCASQVVSSRAIPGPTKQAFFELTMKEIEAQKLATPKDTRIYVLGGSFLNSIGQATQALPLLEKAYELSPMKQSIALPLATDYLNTGKNDQAIALLEKTYQSATNNTNVRNTYAMALVVIGKEADARKMFDNDPKIFESQQMAQVYVSLKNYTKAIALYQNLVKANPENVDMMAQLAQIQFAAGQKWASIETLKEIQKIKPELKDQIESYIKEIQSK